MELFVTCRVMFDIEINLRGGSLFIGRTGSCNLNQTCLFFSIARHEF